MVTGDAAPPPLSIPPPPIEPLSDDDGSSPLSDVHDKDGDTEDFHDLHDNITLDRDQDESSSDELSDANDTEAETERLYDTPQNPSRHKDVILDQSAQGTIHERTPSKLRQQSNVVALGDADDGEVDDPLSDQEDVSMASSPPAQALEPPEKLPSPTLDILAEAANREAENRKRKRSSMPADADGDADAEAEPLSRRRTDSVPAPSREDADNDTAMADDDEDDELSLHSNSGEPSADEAPIATVGEDDADEPQEDQPTPTDGPTKKQTRSGSRRIKDVGDAVDEEELPEEPQDLAGADVDGVANGDDEPGQDEVDEEAEAAEAAHKNEEELERKRQAYEQLTSIEKRFTIFRDRLYEERLDQLNREEAMLRSDHPTHPEYLAMMQCVDARRDEKVRRANRELDFKMESLGRWAVARRAQIHSQFFQSIRESRERVMAELGQQWYDVQHERRKQANNVPEFGLRFPQSQTEHVLNALAYNKEVSILSGVAKHEGMPAAPDMRGATFQECDDDFEAMGKNRRPSAQQSQVQRPSYADYGGLPFGQGLGPAGEQFLEQTPWANPQHPSHAQNPQRQGSAQQDQAKSSFGARRHSTSQNRNPLTSSTTPNSSQNGNSKSHKGLPRHPSTSPEVTRAASLLEQTSARSLKAAVAEASIKKEQAVPVGGA